MDPSYARLGPIVSIVPTDRRRSSVTLVVAAVAVLLFGFLALAASIVMGRTSRTDSSEPVAAASMLGSEPVATAPTAEPTSAAAPVAAAPEAAAVDPTPARAASSSTSDDEPQVRTERERPSRRAVRRARRAQSRRVARGNRHRHRAVASRRAAPESNEPRRLVRGGSARGGFGNSSDVMRSLGL